jgi:hypothetical protein
MIDVVFTRGITLNLSPFFFEDTYIIYVRFDYGNYFLFEINYDFNSYSIKVKKI